MRAYFIKLCWKNIWRNKRRTFLTVNAIGFGVTALVCIYNFYDAFHEQIVHNVIQYHSGHLIVTAPGYLENKSPKLYMKDTVAQSEWLAKRPEIKSASERVLVQGLVSSANGSANILFTGVNPERESQVTKFSSNIVAGNYLSPGQNKPIVIGKGLSELLKVEVGSKVVALTQGIDGSIGNELFYVSGIFETHSDIDKSLAFIPLEDARTLQSLPPGSIHQLSIILKEDSAVEKIRDEFALAFPVKKEVANEANAQMMTWMEVQRPLMAVLELDKSFNRLLMIIILFVAALGIANSILMSIMERIREFGVMMAIGTTKAEVIRMVVVETLMLGVVGVFLGNLFGVGWTMYFNHRGFDLKWLTSHNIVIEGMKIQTVSYPVVHWDNSGLITGVILALTVIVSIIPARHIAKLTAVEALRAH